MKPKDYYETLGIERTASKAEIKKAFYNLARKYHPDLHGSDDYFLSKFNEVNEAYSILGDLDKRLDYSLQLYRYEEIKAEAIEKLKEMQSDLKGSLKKKNNNKNNKLNRG